MVVDNGFFLLELLFLVGGGGGEFVEVGHRGNIRGILDFHRGDDAEHADTLAHTELEGLVETGSLMI